MNEAMRYWRGDRDFVPHGPGDEAWPLQTFWYVGTGDWQPVGTSELIGNRDVPSTWFELDVTTLCWTPDEWLPVRWTLHLTPMLVSYAYSVFWLELESAS